MLIQDLFFSAILFSNIETILSSTVLDERRLKYFNISSVVAMMTRSVKNAVTIVDSVVFKIGKINGKGILRTPVYKCIH